MKALVTGAAGFIGSTLVDALVAGGSAVRGVDCLTPYYEPTIKRRNLEGALQHPVFELIEADLRVAELSELLDGIDVVFHQAAQPGVRLSWADGFGDYETNNVLATQRLLEASRTASIDRFVFASSSSVYGNSLSVPSRETDLPQPHSPYGVTKLAAEHLCGLYAANWGVPTVSLRYFTVYGPRQRPDMAIGRLLEAGLSGEPFPLYGDGGQKRDFTFVDDVVAANVAAATAELPPGAVLNIAGGSSVTVTELMALAAEAVGAEIRLDRLPAQPGDVRETGGATELSQKYLGWAPRTLLVDGLSSQAAWLRGTTSGSRAVP